jgi:hypothetical protein
MQHFSIPWLRQNEAQKNLLAYSVCAIAHIQSYLSEQSAGGAVFRVCDSTHGIIPIGTKRRRRCI